MYKSPEEKRLEHITVGTALAAGAAAVVGVAALEMPKDNPHKPATPIEQPGIRQGVIHNTEPGIGTIHSNGRNFSVTQTAENAGGIGTAVAAEKQGDHFVEVDPITLAKK